MRVLQAVAAALAASLAGIAASQSPAGAGNLTLVAGSKYLLPTGPGPFTAAEPSRLASGDFQGGTNTATNTAAILNPPRPVTITSSTATTNAGITVTVNGLDRAGMSISEAITGPAGSASVSTVRLFAVVTSIAVSAAATSIEAGWDGTSFSRWINLANRSGNYQHKIIVLAGSALASDVFLETTSMAMSAVAAAPAGSRPWSATDDSGSTWTGGDYPDDVEQGSALSLAANSGNGTYTYSVTTDNSDPWAYVRLKVAAGADAQVVLRVIPTRTA